MRYRQLLGCTDDAMVSNAHTPAWQIGDAVSTATTPSVQVSVPSSSSEFLGVPADVTTA
jgi:hypothetical protein